MTLDLDGMNLPELKALRRRLDRTIANFQERARSKAREAADTVARTHGFSLNDLLDSSARKRRKAEIPAASLSPKFRHPEDAGLTWSGRGRRPGWFVEALASGRTEDELRGE